MNKLPVLKKVREIFKTRDRWCQFSMARDSKGNITYVNSNEAVCWCIAGALWKESVDTNKAFTLYDETISYLSNKAGTSIIGLNDDVDGYERVCRVLDKAIEELETLGV